MNSTDKKEKKKKRLFTKSTISSPSDPVDQEVMNIKDYLDFEGLDSDEVKILEYMTKTNRPYSAMNVFENLHGSIKKKNVQKKLERLAETGNLTKKLFGKTSIYFINQQLIDGKEMKQIKLIKVDKSKVEEATLEYNRTKVQFDSLNEQIKENRNLLKKVQRKRPTVKILSKVENMKKELKALKEKLEDAQANKEELIEPEVMEKLKKKHLFTEQLFKERLKLYKNIFDMIEEGSNMKRNKILAKIGLEKLPFL